MSSISKSTFVIKFGGSVFSTSEDKIFDVEKAKNLINFLRKYFSKYKFIVVVGGGFLARKYIKFIEENSNVNINEKQKEKIKHEVGVASININAIVLSSLFEENEVEEKIFRYTDFDEETEIQIDKNVLISAAGHPGYSSDYNAYQLAIRAKAKGVISLKNVDGVYTKDPKKFKDAKPISNCTWEEYLKIIGNPVEFKAGGNYPVDPLTAKLALKRNVRFFIVKGDEYNYSEVEKILLNQDFIGTIIS